jgi:hypothetical protein
MTNATVTEVTGGPQSRILKLKYKDGEAEIEVAPNQRADRRPYSGRQEPAEAGRCCLHLCHQNERGLNSQIRDRGKELGQATL